MMKKVKYTILLLILCTSALFAAESMISYFNASSDGSRVKVEWRTSDESNIQKFDLERSIKSQSFSKIATIETKGNSSSYNYTDDEVYKTSLNKETQLESSNIFTYRLKIIKKDNSSEYSSNVTVSHSTSGIKRTWGMIKEMFK